VLLLGCAWQQGLVPISLDALMRAIELNAIEVDNNKQAFTWGRIAAVDPKRIAGMIGDDATQDDTLDDLIARRAEFLVGYQNQALADRYVELVKRVRDTEGSNDDLARAVAKSYFKLLSYKDEYEVARLHTRTEFLESVRRDFGNKAKIRFHLAPPILNREKDARGRPRKKEFGAWIVPAFRLLAGMRRFRGTWLDVFGMTAERRMERALITEFEALLEKALPQLNSQNVGRLRENVARYMDIRGYGPVKEQAVRDVREQITHV